MSGSVTLSIVIAVEHAQDNINGIVERLSPGSYPEVEFLFCYGASDAQVPALLPVLPNIKALEINHSDSRIPQLWRIGILAARADWVVTTTAHCIPEPDWLNNLLSLTPQADVAAIGGVITNADSADAMSWAIYLQRYIIYAPPQLAREVTDVAADNACYRRAYILHHHELLRQGFWEPEFHQRFQRDGKRLLLTPELCVSHHNNYSAKQFFAQRKNHGFQFALDRSKSFSTLRCLIYSLLSPLLPGVFLLKILQRTLHNRNYRRHLPQALLWLLWFLLAWGIGESKGYFIALRRFKFSN